MAAAFNNRSYIYYRISMNMISKLNYKQKQPTPITIFSKQTFLPTLSNCAARRYCNVENTEESSETVGKKIDPSKDRRIPIPFEVCMEYMESDAYNETYGNNPVWKHYRRNFKGQFQPLPRKTCIEDGIIIRGNPCPICRDEYLTLHYTNVKLLKQFISPFTGEVYSNYKTGLCARRHKELLVAVGIAKDYGYIEFDVPFRSYNYSDYYTFTNKK